MTPARIRQLKECDCTPRPGDLWRIDPVMYTVRDEHYGINGVVDCSAANFRLGMWMWFLNDDACYAQHVSDGSDVWNVVSQPVSRGRPWPTWLDRTAQLTSHRGPLVALVAAVSTVRLEPNVSVLCLARVQNDTLCAWLP